MSKDKDTFENTNPGVNVQLVDDANVEVRTNLAPAAAIIVLSAAIETIAAGLAEQPADKEAVTQ